ncbi:hypothetical protein QMS95_02870 [Cronobacter sakazakii]|uniref:hypothetical protein n=1 Tax=Cronobacter sakazakii TaxID=28141 RepID=UPI00352A9831
MMDIHHQPALVRDEALYNRAVKLVEAVQETLKARKERDDFIHHVIYAQCAMMDDAVRGWMPPGYTLYHDLLSLLRVYLGWRYDACISLTFPRRLLPAPRLTARDHKDSVYMGYSFLLGHDPDDTGPDPEMPDEVTIKLGRYEGLKKNPVRREVTEVED